MKIRKLVAGVTAASCLISTFMITECNFLNKMKTKAFEAVKNDFEVTYEGWYANENTAKVEVIDGLGFKGSRGMIITNRQSSNVGVASAKGFYIWGGIEYNYSVQVKADTDEIFHISLLYKDELTDQAETIELASKCVKAGEWTEISNSFMAPKNTYEYLITITTETTNDFVFDNMIITTFDTNKIMEAKAVAENGLKDVFKGYGFRVGNIFNGQTIKNSAIQANFLKDCNAVECENETKADSVLVKNNSSNTNINVSLKNCAAIADFAEKNGIAFRGHAFVWHSQTPAWFLKENFNENANWVTPSVMDQRLESYIRNVFAAFKEQYPSLNLYAYDICNECVSDDSNRTQNNGGAREPGDNNKQGGKSAYVAVYGDNKFIEKAFIYARKYAPANCKLYYNDYNEYWDHKRDCIINTILKPLSEKGLIDGMGMQSHVDAGYATFSGTANYLNTMDMYLRLGLDVQVTELDVSLENGQSLNDQADKYKNIVQHIVDVNTSGKYNGKVTLFQIWGPNDANTWISGNKQPTLYDGNNNPKIAYTSLIQYGQSLKIGPIDSINEDIVLKNESSDSFSPIPVSSSIISAFDNITLNTSYKKDGENNCLYTQRFGADPGWLVYNGRLYVYTTNDSFEYRNGQIVENSYDVGTINCVSSADLVNWTDHGSIPVAARNGRTINGVAMWANNSWAPDAIWKTINGKDKFFLYFADNGSGIGVLTADSPIGPWTDPIGKQIISRNTPNCGNVAWLFDPGVYYDPITDEGYIAFGGGKNENAGSYADPGTGRMVKLTSDCIGIDGSAKIINPPYFFEDSSLIKIGNNWVYSFCHNWNVPSGTSVNGHSFGNADIGYMIGSNPMDGTFKYSGVVFKNTGTQRLDNGGNNHHSIIEFKGRYYVIYHSRQLEMRMGVNGGKGLNYRSPCIDSCSVNNNSISCNGTIQGVAQLETLNPFEKIQAETMSNQTKSVSVSGLGDTKVIAKKGDWIKISGVNFSRNVNAFTAKGKGGAIKITVDSPIGTAIAYSQFGVNEEEVTFKTVADIIGTKDIFITFGADNMELDYWSFS